MFKYLHFILHNWTEHRGHSKPITFKIRVSDTLGPDYFRVEYHVILWLPWQEIHVWIIPFWIGLIHDFLKVFNNVDISFLLVYTLNKYGFI